MASSSSYSRKLPNDLGVTFGTVAAENGNGPEPKRPCSTVEAVAPMPQCAQGYSGCIGSASRADQFADPLARIAVTGRQELYVNFASQMAICESIVPKFSRAIALADLTISSALACTA